MDAQMKVRLRWIDRYQETGTAGPTCRSCGISRPALPLWSRSYEAEALRVYGLAAGDRHAVPISRGRQ